MVKLNKIGKKSLNVVFLVVIKYEILAFPDTYYELIINLLQSVEL